MQEVLVLGCIDFCARRRWRCHAVGTDPTHVHVVVGWFGYMAWHEAMRRLKNILSLLLGRYASEQGKRWFVGNGSRKRVLNRDHLNYLAGTYLPDHRGAFWCEGQPTPDDRFGVL